MLILNFQEQGTKLVKLQSTLEYHYSKSVAIVKSYLKEE